MGWRAGVLFTASCGVVGCNLLVGLDDVSVAETGAGGTSGGVGATTGGAASSSGVAGSSNGGGTGGAGHTGGTAATTGGLGGSGGTATGGPGGGAGAGAGAGTGGNGGTASAGGTSAGGTGGVAVTSGGSGGTTSTSTSSSTSSTGGGGGGGPGPTQEVVCGDGIDNDGDMMADAADADCALPGYATLPCAVFRIYRSEGPPQSIPDFYDGHAELTVSVPDDLAVAHTSVLLNVTHPRDSDVEVGLFPPFGTPRSLTSDNGGNGANYTDTLFDDGCLPSVESGSAPFQSCFAPEASLPSNGQSAKGSWTLRVDDDGAGQTGTLDGWALVLCSQ